MSETIQVALITLAAGVLGALVGPFGNWLAARRETKRRIRDEKRDCYTQFLAAYQALLGAIAVEPNLKDGLPPAEEIDLFDKFQIATTQAMLLCADPVRKHIEQLYVACLQLHLREASKNITQGAYRATLDAMREDLAQ